MPQFSPGSVFAGHRIEEIAGRGGMGVVYRVRHVVLDVPMALKLIADDLARDPQFRERFTREARMAAQLRHPNVVRVFDAGEVDGVLYVTMDFIEGSDLRTLIGRTGRLEPSRATRIVLQIASALDAAHARGLVHRDVKPANILVEGAEGREHAYLTDFGLIKQLAADSGLTRTGTWIGTLDYMAPEQIRGTPVSAATDVYALGCVLFHALTGSQPFKRDSDPALMSAHLFEPPPEASSLAPSVGPALDRVLARAMAKEPEDRHPSAGALAREADEAVRAQAPEVGSSPSPVAPAPTQAPPPYAPTPRPTPPPTFRSPSPTPAPIGSPAPQQVPPPFVSAPVSPTAPLPPPQAPFTRLPEPAAPPPYGRSAPPRRSRLPLVLAVVGGAALAIAAVVALLVLATGKDDAAPQVSAAEARKVIRDYISSYDRADDAGLRRSLAADAKLTITGGAFYSRRREIAFSRKSSSAGERYSLETVKVGVGGQEADASAPYGLERAGQRIGGGLYGFHLRLRGGRLQIDRVTDTPAMEITWNVFSKEAPTTLTIIAQRRGREVGRDTYTFKSSGNRTVYVPVNAYGRRALRDGDRLEYLYRARLGTGKRVSERSAGKWPQTTPE